MENQEIMTKEMAIQCEVAAEVRLEESTDQLRAHIRRQSELRKQLLCLASIYIS